MTCPFPTPRTWNRSDSVLSLLSVSKVLLTDADSETCTGETLKALARAGSTPQSPKSKTTASVAQTPE
jgi:hypothetical protein